MADFEIKGIDAALKKMRDLPLNLQKKGLRAALRKGAVQLKKIAQNNAGRIDDPDTRESIQKNIAAQPSAKLGRSQGGVAYRVGVLGGARKYANTKHNVRKGRRGKFYKTDGSGLNPGGDTYYWRFVEFGTQKTRAQPFLRPALAENVETVTNTITAELSKQIDKAVP